VAVAILTILGLMLTVAISSSENLTSLARERAIANNVIRAYIERQRATYPLQNSTDMINFVRQLPTSSSTQPSTTSNVPLADPSVPTYDLYTLYPAGSVERSVLNNVVARVSMATFEDGTNWGPCYSTNISVAPVSTASPPSVGNQITAADKLALGLPRDLNADGTVTPATPSSNPNAWGSDVVYLECGLTPSTNIASVPVKIELFWTTGSTASGVQISAGTAVPRQSMTIYAIFSASH